MLRPVPLAAVVAAALAAAAGAQSTGVERPARQDPELAREPSWSRPDAKAARARVERALADLPAGPPDERAAALDEAWSEVVAGNGDLLDAVLETIAAREPRAAAVSAAAAGRTEPALAWLDETATPELVRDAVRLWWGRELVRHDRFDEALPLLADLDVDACLDPATLLFLRGCCQHWLLQVEAAVESLDRLLEREDEIPVRYARVARLLRADIGGLEADSLDHVARRMRDVRRRLALGLSGPVTRGVQDGVIESLDKMIEDLEKQRQGGQGQAGAGGGDSGQGGGGRPMDDSRIAGGRGPGEVQARDLGAGDGWGNLPPHEREQALQQIDREFPPHYRDAIEQYFKRLAAGDEEAP